MRQVPDRVADAMLIAPKVCSSETRVDDLRDLFEDDHVHCGLVVDGSRLVSVVERSDLVGAPGDATASRFGRLEGRTAAADADLASVHERMLAGRVRRLAVVGAAGELLGLLCLKNSGTGFCTEDGVAARAAERRAAGRVPAATTFDAIVLAGGRSSRMGREKTALTVGGIPIIDRVLDALADAEWVVAVGPDVDGGPVAALASALPAITADIVVTLAGDLPLIGGGISHLLAALADAPEDTHAAVLIAGGRRQYLAAAWRRAALEDCLAALTTTRDVPMRALFTGPVAEVPDKGHWSLDVDTPSDLAAARTAALAG